jgi:hypothetical protein
LYLEDGGSKFLVGVSLPGYMVSHSGDSALLIRHWWEPQISLDERLICNVENSFVLLISAYPSHYVTPCYVHIQLRQFDILHGIICAGCFNMIRFIPVVSRRPDYEVAEVVILTLLKLLMCLLSGDRGTTTHFPAYFFN